ncbi:MAG: MiaB/RimO family radical SAM methylthiotransferase, partial [Kiritimatiellaeota bacterium]|nr:MiaB/RimO family radical SAM methylthiotransferase [Kiritimatiellota bacterium]
FMQETTVSVKTVGCRLNQAETARLRAAFQAAGYRVVPFGAACKVCVIHGCAVTAKAEQNSARLARSARRQTGAFVVLAGCPVSGGGRTFRVPDAADLLVGQADKFRLPALLAEHGFPSVVSGLPRAASGTTPALPLFDTTRAIVKIQDGCDFHCAYCVVPRARGPAWSRPFEEIVEEINGLVHAGYREIVLTGANIGCYEDHGRKLACLLSRIETVPALERIRLSSIEVSTVEREVIDCMAASRKLCRCLHLPMQSGSDPVLRAMRRKYAIREYGAVVAYAVSRVEGIGIGTDVLVGFPGECAADFDATEAMIAQGPFSNVHVFAYSLRPGTPAALMNGQVPDSEKRRRVAKLLALAREKRMAFARRWVGREVAVLVEAVNAAGVATGWTGEYLPARILPPSVKAGGGLPARTVPTRNRIIRFVPRSVEDDTLIGDQPIG